MTGTGDTVDFTYNADGLRVRKESTARGVTEYILSGKQITHLTRKEDGPLLTEMHFWYDAQGKAAMVSYNGNDYVYVYNAQGDVVALLDKANHHIQVVAYAYDPWGKQVACTGTMANTLGVENPFRYRGYVFDVETGLYYLRSRYYNPEWGRFLNSDALITRNLFAYCNNNPIILHDPTGAIPQYNDPKYIAAMEARGRAILAAEAAKKGSATVSGTSKTVTIYGPYAEAIANRLKTPNTTYEQSDCQNEVRLVLPNYDLKGGSGGMWKYNVTPHANAQADDLVFSNCSEAKHKSGLAAIADNNCKTYANDHKGHVGLVVWADWHDNNGPVLSVFQSCAVGTNPAKALWENDKLGGSNLTGFSDVMVYFGTIKPEFLK